MYDPQLKSCPVCSRTAPVQAILCAGCGFDFGHGTLPRQSDHSGAAVSIVLTTIGLIIFCGWIAFSRGWLQIALPGPASSYSQNAERVKYGMTVEQVTDLCGKPDRTQRMETGGSRPDRPDAWQDYLYYDDEGRRYQLVFENGLLVSINY